MMWWLGFASWFAFWVGFLAGILWASHCERRRIRQATWQFVHGVSDDRHRTAR
jgi:hypothetical protein